MEVNSKSKTTGREVFVFLGVVIFFIMATYGAVNELLSNAIRP